MIYKVEVTEGFKATLFKNLVRILRLEYTINTEAGDTSATKEIYRAFEDEAAVDTYFDDLIVKSEANAQAKAK
jgi:hypothetical protein